MNAKWSYKIVRLDSTGWFSADFEAPHVEAKLNVYGAEGWELVSTVLGRPEGKEYLIATFKRPQ